MTVPTDADLWLRGTETLLASWEEYAREATDCVARFPGVASRLPERGPSAPSTTTCHKTTPDSRHRVLKAGGPGRHPRRGPALAERARGLAALAASALARRCPWARPQARYEDR